MQTSRIVPLPVLYSEKKKTKQKQNKQKKKKKKKKKTGYPGLQNQARFQFF